MNVYDVAILSDLRYPGGNSASIVAEIRAQAAAGLSTVLVHVTSPHLKRDRPFQAGIIACLREGLADLAVEGTGVTAGLLLIRQPRLFTQEPAAVPEVHAARTVLVLNQPPGDAGDPERYYRFGEVKDRVERLFGTSVEWAPISPTVRAQVQRVAPEVALAPDWHEIIDVGDWRPSAERRPSGTPVLGRHGRPDPVKWPRDPAQLVQAYPETGDVRVRFLGGGEIATQRLGRQPSNWELIAFGAESPRDFLASLDFFVYFHDPDWVEAFGRTILEAMAAGVPVIVGPHFRGIFGDAALYCEPAGVMNLVRALVADPVAYRAVVARADAYIAAHYGPASHLARLGVRATAVRPITRATPPADGPKRRVLFLTDEPDRTLAIAPHLAGEFDVVVATGSGRLAELHDAGLLGEYLPSAEALGVTATRWAGVLRDRLRHLIELHRPDTVVVDGRPHDGILAATADHPGVRWLWIREAMWRRGAGARWLGRTAAFDGVLEPGEFAGPGDEGLTAFDRIGVTTCAPIVRGRPRSDIAVAGADYTSFHELLSARVPTVFVPDRASPLHDEVARARFAAAAGAALCVDHPERLPAVLEQAARPEVRAALAQRCAEVAFANGAADAAAWIAGRSVMTDCTERHSAVADDGFAGEGRKGMTKEAQSR